MMSEKSSEEQMTKQREQAEQAIEQAIDRMGSRIVVFSGKGGVGKTTVAVNLAYTLARRGIRVGLLDADVTGPNVPQMTGIDEPPKGDGQRLVPHERSGVKIVSLASMLAAGVAVIWRGPMRSKVLEQLLGETEWGDLDALIVDLPPGTGDEILTITQKTAPQIAIVVTTPQEVALIDARRAISFARKLEIPTIGIVENMSGLACPHCGGRIELFGSEGGRREADRQGIAFLGSVPIDPATREGGDAGRPIVLADPAGSVSKAFEEIASGIEKLIASHEAAERAK
jgi:ATP-binding protein involved in chromosome partitioning